MINLDELMPFLIDTNTLIRYSHLINKFQVVITSNVLREIEKLELTKQSDKELQSQITKAKQMLDDNEDIIVVNLKDYEWDLDDDFDKEYVDNKIIKCCIENGYGLLTRDRLLRLKAKMYNIPVIKPEKISSDDFYTGYKIVSEDDEKLHRIFSTNENVYELYTNQYLIIRDSKEKTKEILRWTGNAHVRIEYPESNYIKPENDLQACALDLLMNKEIPVKFILGTYGSGKTFLETKVALHKINEEGDHAKIMMIRNPIGTGEQIGWLKGDKDEKTAGFFKPIIQHLEGGEQEAFELEQEGKLLKEIPFYMKGLSIDDTFMIVDEAEDLDIKLIKLIGTRIGDNTVCAFSGDYNQAEGKYINNNGLLYAVEGLKGNPLVGIIVLDLDVRSNASKIFADL